MADVITIPMRHEIPAGMLGPEPVTIEVRAFLVPHGSGLVLVDTGMDPAGAALDAALADEGAGWSDVTDVLITHGHPDHTGAIGHVRAVAPDATVHAHADERLDGARPLHDGTVVAGLRVFATPGHTPGHISLLDDDRGLLLVGDCLGVVDGRLVRAPAQFTADADQAESSLDRLRQLRGARMLVSHGPEIGQPWDGLDELLASG